MNMGGLWKTFGLCGWCQRLDDGCKRFVLAVEIELPVSLYTRW